MMGNAIIAAGFIPVVMRMMAFPQSFDLGNFKYAMNSKLRINHQIIMQYEL